MTDDNDVYTPAQAREYVDGYGDRDPDAHPHAGLITNQKIRRYGAIMREMWDPEKYAKQPGKFPADAADLPAIQQMEKVEATGTFGEAIKNGDTQTQKHFTGDSNQRADVSGIKAIGKIDELVKGPAPVIVLLGEMGAGKSDFAGLLGQRTAFYADGPLKVASNIKTLQETTEWTDQEGNERDGWVPDFPTLKDWVRHEGDPLQNEQSRKLFIGDEFSISASGHGAAGHETATKMGPLIYLIRKYNGVLIYVAHGPKSIHPLMWRVGVIVKKESLKKAVVAEEISNNKLAGIRDEIEGIPPTDWRMRTEEASTWSWSRSTTDDGEEINAEDAARAVAIWTTIRCKEQGMSDRATAEYVPYSRGWVNSRWNEYQDEGKHRETVDMVETVCV